MIERQFTSKHADYLSSEDGLSTDDIEWTVAFTGGTLDWEELVIVPPPNIKLGKWYKVTVHKSGKTTWRRQNIFDVAWERLKMWWHIKRHGMPRM